MNGAVLTVDQMRAAEQAAMDAGISEWELMRRAGQGAAQWIWRTAGGRSVCVLCGPGNNGGDGYVIAESLRRRGIRVEVIAPLEPKTATSQKARQAFGGLVGKEGLPQDDVYVDCLFGYGLAREVEGEFAALLRQLAQAKGSKIAIDVPSSVCSDTGAFLGPKVRYDLTIALGAWKHAHFTMPGMPMMGATRLVEIGLAIPGHTTRLSSAPQLSAPADHAHKYRRGLLAILAGEMPGASLLAAESAMRSGAGYVKLLSEHSHPSEPADLVIDGEPLDKALGDERIGAILVGPGLGRDTVAQAKLQAALGAEKPVILDADALHLLTPDKMMRIDASRVGVTPHEGELAKLCEAFDVSGGSKIERAAALSRKSGMTVLAKGPDTILVTPDGALHFGQGSTWLSTAGTGDVLAGIAASRLAVHGQVAKALEEAVWLHHEAARLAGEAFTAGELARTVSQAMRSFL